LVTCLRHVLRHTVSLDGCSWIDGLKLPGPGDGCRPPIPGASGSGCCRAHSRGDYRPLRGGSRAPAAGSGCQGDRIVGFAIWVDMRPGICLGCRGPRRFPPLPGLPQGPTCVWLGGGAAAGRIPRSQRTPRVAGKPSRRIEGTQAGRRAKATVEPERNGISSDSTVGSQFPPMPYNVQGPPNRPKSVRFQVLLSSNQPLLAPDPICIRPVGSEAAAGGRSRRPFCYRMGVVLDGASLIGISQE